MEVFDKICEGDRARGHKEEYAQELGVYMSGLRRDNISGGADAKGFLSMGGREGGAAGIERCQVEIALCCVAFCVLSGRDCVACGVLCCAVCCVL